MKWSWTVITPLLCVVRTFLFFPPVAPPPPVLTLPLPVQGCFVFSLVKYKPLTYNKVYEYPDWAIALGWTLALASMICIPMVVVIKIIQSDGPLIEVGGPSVPAACRPSWRQVPEPLFLPCSPQRIKAVAAPVRGGASSRPKELTFPLDPNGNSGGLKAPTHIIVETMM